MTTAIYARTSKENNDRSYSTTSQVDYCKKYAIEHSMHIREDYVFREDFTGTVLDRPEIAKLRKLVKVHAVDSVIIYATDRLARETWVGTTLFDEMCKNGVLLHIVRWGTYVRSDNASDKFRFDMEMSISNFEKENIKERMMRGKITKASQGKLVPHAKPLYGYSVNELKDNLDPNKYAPIVKEILESYGLKHINPSVIADRLNLKNVPTPGVLKAEQLEESANKKLRIGSISQEDYEKFLKHAEWVRGNGVWSTAIIHSILNNAKDYTGNYTFKIKGVTYTVHPTPIISVEVAESVENMLATGKTRFARKEGIGPYLMARRLKCTCGYSYAVRPKKSKYFNGYYACMNTKHTCSNKPIRNDVLDPLAKDFVRFLVLHPDKLFQWWEKQHEQNESANAQIREEIADIDKKIVELQKKLRRVLDRLTDNLDEDEVPIFEDQRDRIKKDLADFRKRRQDLEQSLVVPIVSEETIRSFSEIGEDYKDLLEEVHEISFWRTLVDKIDLTGEIGTDEKGQFIDFIVLGSKRKREYLVDKESDGS